MSWQEQLFRMQFAKSASDLMVQCILTHLQPFIPRCLPLYLTYYTLRCRGYTLHEGMKLGVDYVVYPAGGAHHWHAQ